jgi:hypothetical protein
MAVIKSKSQIRTPAGGMNQDDSLITPSYNNASRNSFQTGDYRYALNARIGSSRGDNFGDLENIRDTVRHDTYYKRVGLFSNSDFINNLTPWLQISTPSPNTWEWVSGYKTAAIMANMSGTWTIYQGVSITSRNVFLKYSYSVNKQYLTGGTLQFKIVYLNGTTVISEAVLAEYAGTATEIISKSIEVTLPINCNGIGFKVVAGSNNPAGIFRLNKMQGYAWEPSVMPSGINKVIGKLEDTEFQRIYEAVWNSEGNHTIRYFDPYVNSTYELLPWTGLKFLPNSFVKFAKLDNWISITDRNSPPRLFDTDTIQDLYADLGASDFREFHITLHKWAPTVPPIPRAFYNGFTNNYEKLKNRVFHFSYRYLYYGNLKSRWSPESKGAVTTTCGFFTDTNADNINKLITSIEVDIPGSLYDDPASTTAFNYFDHNNIKFLKAVQAIEIAFRDGEQELWKLWKVVPVDKLFNRYQYFNGDGNLTPVAINDFNQIFDTVPFLAGTIESADNRFVLGDCLDELPPATGLEVTNVKTIIDQSVSIEEGWDNSYPFAFLSIPAGPRADLVKKNALSFFNFKDRGAYKVGLQWLANNGWRSAVYTIDNWMYNPTDTDIDSVNKALAFNFTLNVIPPEWAVGYQLMRTNCLNISYFMYGPANQFRPIIDNVSVILDQLELPQDVKDSIRQHFDNERLVDAQDVTTEIEKQIKAAIPKQHEFDDIENMDFWELGSFGTGIGNQSPIGRLKSDRKNNSIAKKLQQQIRKTKEIPLLANASRIFIDMNNWYFGAKKSGTIDNPTAEHPLNKLFYNYREGDRIRFTGSDIAAPTVKSSLKEYDVAIIEFTGKGIIIEKPPTLKWIQSTASVSGYHFTIEVYTPQTPTLANHLFFETGEWYPVLYPGKSNRALSKSDFVYTTNAAVTATTYGPFNIFHKHPFFYADCYKGAKALYRDTITINSGSPTGLNLSMTPDPDETFGFWDHNNGRVAPAYRDIPVSKFKKTQVRFGGKIIEESSVNNLNNFLEEDQFIYPSEYGRIRNLINTSNAQVESVGSILLALGEREAWSIYVNRTTLEDLSGNTQVALSNQVLGSYNSLLGSHGTLNPESVSTYRGNVYWWDAINGSWVRYGRDGLTPISDYKMRNWFKEIGTLLINKYFTDEVPTAISEFDPFNMELITYINHSSLPATFRGYEIFKGAVFSENDKTWKRCHSDQPEMFVKMNSQLYSFLLGNIYQHEAGIAYSTFYGVKQNVQWEPVFNDESEFKRSWQAFAEVATHKWSVERILSEFRGNKIKQQTRISLDKFDEREDNFYSDIPRDINSPGANPVIEGDRMRSKAIQVLMQLDPAVVSLSLLHYVYAICEDSPKNS